MSYELLISTAAKLPDFSKNTCNEYEVQMEIVVAKMNDLMLKREDIKSLIGPENIEMMKDNHSNHARFILSYINNPAHEVLVDTVLWVFRAYRTHGFSSNYWSAQLNNWTKVLEKELSEETFSEIIPLYNWMIINIPLFVKVSDSQLELKNSSH